MSDTMREFEEYLEKMGYVNDGFIVNALKHCWVAALTANGWPVKLGIERLKFKTTPYIRLDKNITYKIENYGDFVEVVIFQDDPGEPHIYRIEQHPPTPKEA